MLEHYFTKPETVDRIRESWVGEPIEQYVIWLSGQGLPLGLFTDLCLLFDVLERLLGIWAPEI